MAIELKFATGSPSPPPLAGEVKESRAMRSIVRRAAGGGILSTRHLLLGWHLHPDPPPRRCSDRGHGGQVFGDIVDTFDIESRRLSDAVPRGMSDGFEIGICDVGVGRRGECSEALPSLRCQPDDWLQMAGALAA